MALPVESPSSDYESISLKVNQQRIETELIVKAFTLSHGNSEPRGARVGHQPIHTLPTLAAIRHGSYNLDSLRMPAGPEQAVMSDH
ncbi:MAG: hypothetical protein U0361_06190 [Nitrospiraceae bacterium]